VSKGPKFFQKLDKSTQESIEQVLHGLMGFFGEIVGLGQWLLWRRECVTQWPPGDTLNVSTPRDGYPNKASGSCIAYQPLDRVQDMANDWKSYAIGGSVMSTLKSLAIAGLLIYITLN